MKKVVIIGGGAAGLAAAYKVKRAAEEGHELEFTLVEKDDRIGGKIATESIEGFVVDGGPDCFLTEKPAVHRIARLVGLEAAKLPSDESRKKTWILSRGKKFEMPDGVMMFAPTKFVPFATTGLFSWPGKIRMGMDLLIPKKKTQGDETLESFVVRRMGRECLDRLAEPLVGGVHASDPAKMSLAATFPRLLDMEQSYGSMIGGFVAARRKVAEMKKKYPPKPGQPPRTFFTSFEAGMQQLTDAMADAVGRENIRTGVAVEGIEKSDGAWRVRLTDGEVLDADAVVVATEAWAAAQLLSGVDGDVAATLGEIENSGSATVSMGFDEATIGVDMNAFGVLCPLVEGRKVMAVTYSSTKWPGRAPEGSVLFRGFVGGPHDQSILEKSDDEIVSIVLAEFRDILGIKGEPLFAKVFRWPKGMPQYTLGHLERIEFAVDKLAEVPGVMIAGGSYTGVGIPNCIESGEAAVSKVLGDLGLTLAEDAAEPEKRHY